MPNKNVIKKEEIKKFIKFLGHEKQSELRLIEPRWKNVKPIPIQKWVNNEEEFLKEVEKYNGEYNMYVGINERKINGDKDDDIEYITNIGHDIDAHSGKDEDFMKAQEVALKIKEISLEIGYKEPLIICSGRGFWVLHHITPIKNTEENIKKIKEFGLKIKEKYEVEGIEFDTSVYNPSRIARIPGTLNISDEKNFVAAFVINDPNGEEDLKLSDDILEIKLKIYPSISTGNKPKDSCAFLDYCLTHEIPSGERHKVISRNMSLYICNNPNRELLKEQYFKIQKGSEVELNQWLKNVDKNGKEKYPFSCGELINFQKKYKLPLKCKGCPKFLEFKKEKKAEKKLQEEIRRELMKEELKKEGKFLFSEFGVFTNYLDMAKEFHSKQPFYYDSHKIWWLWNYKELKWERVDEIDLINAIDDNTKFPTTNSKVKYEILESLRRKGRRSKPKDAEKTWIQFKDKIYDLKTEKIFKVSSKHFITNPIPWSIGLSEETPTIDRILMEWVYKKGIQDKSYVKTLKEIIAYSMLSYMPIHRIFCFIGEGLNGKGTFLRLIEKLIGKDNYCATEIERLSSDRFESNKLHKKLVCFIGEIDKGIFKKTKTIKSLTGEDTVRIEFKGKDGFDGRNYANPLITTNHLPETSDKTKGFYRRWTIVDFPNVFNEKKDILDEIPDEEYNNFCKQALNILKELLINGEFTNDGTIQEREDKYEKHSNYINEFVKLYCENDKEKYIEFADFCEKYNEYLMSDGMIKKSKVEIGRIVTLKGFNKKVKKISTDFRDTTKMCVEGIKWKPEVEELV